MKNLLLITAICGITINPTFMNEDTMFVEFNINPFNGSKTRNSDEAKVMYAQQIADELFTTVEKNNLIIAGKSEEQLNKEVVELARTKFGVEKHWHKKIVRAGANTLA